MRSRAFVPSAALLAQLRAWRYADRAPVARDALPASAAYLGGTIGVSWFLTPDGRVLELSDDGPASTGHEAYESGACWILAMAAWDCGIPDLLDLLPRAPDAVPPCRICKGTHYISVRDSRVLACQHCQGRGWVSTRRFTLSPSLLAKLRAHRDAERARRSAGRRDSRRDAVEEAYDAYLVDPGMGPMTYLTSDGRVLEDLTTFDDGTEPVDGDGVVEVEEESALTAVVCGAHKTGIAELLSLVPPAPAGAVPCEICAGTRWWQQKIVCPQCRGRGWRHGLTFKF